MALSRIIITLNRVFLWHFFLIIYYVDELPIQTRDNTERSDYCTVCPDLINRYSLERTSDKDRKKAGKRGTNK